MLEGRTNAAPGPVDPRHETTGGIARRLQRLGRGLTTLGLDFLVVKAIAIFVWCLSARANRLHFRKRRELLELMKRARAEERPIIVAMNHVSWFDDPVMPMALHRTGQRALLEFAGLGALLVVIRLLPTALLPSPAGIAVWLAAAAAVAAFGARKTWWTLGDQANLSNAAVLRGKFALTRSAPPGRLLGALLDLADSLIPWFMCSGSTKTVFVDRRPGEEAKLSRARAVAETLEIAARLEPVWVFFEGGRSRRPGTIAPARRGVGALVLGLEERGHHPFVVVVCHRGMERVIPPGASRFVSTGHAVEVRWCVLDAEVVQAAAGDAQALADAVREAAVRLQAGDDARDVDEAIRA